jgi:hypothetical protein
MLVLYLTATHSGKCIIQLLMTVNSTSSMWRYTTLKYQILSNLAIYPQRTWALARIWYKPVWTPEAVWAMEKKMSVLPRIKPWVLHHPACSLYTGQVVLALIKMGSYTYQHFPVLCRTYYSQNLMTEAHNTAFSPMSRLQHQGSVYMSRWFSTPTFFCLWECNTKAAGTNIYCYLPVFTIPHNENKTKCLRYKLSFKYTQDPYLYSMDRKDENILTTGWILADTKKADFFSTIKN